VCGRRLWEGSLPWTIFGSGASLLWIGVACVKRIESPWTIFFFIVRLRVPFGMFSSVDLGCLRLCLDN
jgi:hypothetical protein